MSVIVDNLNPSENIVQRTNYLFDIVGFNNTTKVWYANSGSTFASGASTQYNPIQNGTTCSIATGSGDAVLVNYGPNGDKAIKTNGATIIVPIPYYLEDRGVSFQIAVVMGSVAISGSNLTSKFEMEINGGRANLVPGTPPSVNAVGSEVYDTIYLNGKYYEGGQGQRITTKNSIISLTNDDEKSKGIGRSNSGYRLRINGNAIANDDSDAPSFPRPLGFNSFLTIKTSNNCVLRLIGVGPNYAFTNIYNTGIDYREDLTTQKQRDFYIGDYGSYTGSLDGPIKPSLLLSQSTFLQLKTSNFVTQSFAVTESAYSLNLLARFGYPSETENTSSFRYEAVSGGWYDNNTTESKFIPVSFHQTSSLEIIAGASSQDNRKRIVFATSSFGSGSYLIIPSSSFIGKVYTSSSISASIGGILERVQNGSGSTIQIVGTFPSESSQMQLLGNPHQYAGNGTIVDVVGGTSVAIRWDLNASDMILEVQQIKPNYNKTAKFALNKDTSSLHAITLMHTGSAVRVWQGLSEIANTGETLTTFDLFNNLNTSNNYIKFGGNYIKSDYTSGGAYTGKLKGLLIYNRSLTTAELSSSVGFLTSSIL